ncbi:MAG: RNase adapter RapZ [Clostridia bacterium]|nr:RNase adapter RapZ [Clostridia bacterium]
MRFVIITGLSGSGKTSALKHMEDMGYFCVDNLPPTLLPRFADICFDSSTIDKVAIGIDIRGLEFFSGLLAAFGYMEEKNFQYEILFLFADEDELVKRYNFTRRIHPLAEDGRLVEGIRKEQELLFDLSSRASVKIDTTNMNSKTLGSLLSRYYGSGVSPQDGLRITVVSFGFKRGIPNDTDMVFDARFLPNPYNIAELRTHSGLEDCVREYLMGFEQTREFNDKLYDFISFILPKYHQSGKRHLVVAIGCTGGMHRSVATAQALADRLLAEGKQVFVEHRDLESEKQVQLSK